VTRSRYGSDLVVDVLAGAGVEYVAMNPGASFRGVHDSLVNHADGRPAIIETLHEKVAVGIAHGYAKATGKTMAAFTHDLVGLLHGTLGVYYAYVDRAPILVLGGAGPMDQARRRPWIDWIHTANTQNESVRPFTKWDEHPHSVDAIPDAIHRAIRVAEMHPQGPAYVALDASLQEQEIEAGEVPAPLVVPSGPSADAEQLETVAAALARAERPAIVCGYVGRDPSVWPVLVEFAEHLGAAVVDTQFRASFPNRHPLNAQGTDLVRRADVVLLLDVKDIGAHTGLLDKESPGIPPRLAEGATLLDIGFGDLELSSWAAHQGSLYRPDVQVIADASRAVPALLELLRRRPTTDRAAWRAEVRAAADARRRAWLDTATRVGDEISRAWLVHRLGVALGDRDWVLAAGTGGGWTHRLWDFDAPHRHAGRSLGTATQIGISVGVALAHRDVPDRIVVDLQPDGDLLYDPGALWTAAHHRIPMLVVMVNNRLYGNDLWHQQEVARRRSRPIERARVGIEIADPPVDFAGLARSMGWHAVGPVVRPDELDAALDGAIRVIEAERRPVLVDVVVPE
jgi:benzoylformate decarboxylase/acetolactate synthase-1/2/3 large subunit